MVAGLLATVIAGALVAVLAAALRSTQVTRALAADATEAAVIGAYLTRDARSVAAVESLADNDPAMSTAALGVSVLDALGCGATPPTELVVRLAWPSADDAVSVVTYALDPILGILTRTVCERTGTTTTGDATVSLAQGIGAASARCSPSTCVGLPDMLTLTLASDDAEPFRYSVTAGLRNGVVDEPTAPSNVSLAVLGLGGCPPLDLTDSGRTFAAHDVVVDATCPVPLDDPVAQLHAGGSVVFIDDPIDPYSPLLPIPGSEVDSGGAASGAVVVYDEPVVIDGDRVFQPGVHVFERGLSVGAGAQVRGDDVLWYVAGGVTIDPSATVDLDAPDVGLYRGIVLWAATGNPVVVGNGTIPSSFDGAIYAPDAHLTIQRRAGVCVGTIVAGAVTLSGNGPLHLGYGTDPCDTTASLWTPAALGSRLALWLDASDSTSLTIDAADASDIWRDRSGAGRHAVQSRSEQRPRWESGSVNGVAAVRFDGVDDSMELDGSFMADREYTVAAATVRRSARPSNLYLGGDGTEFALGWESTESVVHIHGGADLTAAVTPYAPPAGVTVHMAAATSASRRLRIDGSLRASSDSAVPLMAWSGAAVGAARGSSFDGHVGEIVVVDGDLSAADTARLEAYLAWKWGGAASLPVDHAHVVAPPLSYAPSSPTEVVAVAGDGDALLSWRHGESDTRRTAERFVVQYSTDPSFTEPVTVGGTLGSGDIDSVVVDGLAAVPTWVRVAGANEWGVGPFTSVGPVVALDHRSAVLAASPTGYWRFGEPSGDVAYDESAAAAHGRFSGMELGAPGAVVASADTAVAFDGLASRMEVTTPPGLTGADVTGSVSLWFRTETAGSLVGRSTSTASTPMIAVLDDGTLAASWGLGDQYDGDEVAISAETVADGAWHHAAVTADGATLRLHLDGALVATARTGPDQIGAAPEFLTFGGTTSPGGWWGSATSFAGAIDDVAVFDRALATLDVAALHRSGVTGSNDGIAPPAPTLTLRPTPTHVTASWVAGPSGDQVGYRLFRNGLLIAQRAGTDPVIDPAYASDTDASYAVEAYDVRGNRSPASARTARPMVLVVDTTRSAGTTVDLPLRGAIDVVIDWQGSCATTPPSSTTTIVEAARTTNVSCTFATPGTYTIRVFGSVGQYGFGVQPGTPPLMPNQDKLLAMSAWGDLGVTRLVGAFVRAANLATVPTDLPGTVTDISHMFQRATTINQDLGGWDTSNVTAMSYVFQYASAFNNGCPSGVGQCPSIGSWNMSRVTRTDRMFESASAFNQDIGAWDMSSVTTLQAMFYAAAGVSPTFNNGCAPGVATAECSSIGSWDIGKVTTMRTTFYGATAFNQDVSGWNTGLVTTMYQAFALATRFDQPIGAWDVRNVQSMWRMFNGATAFDGDLGAWRTVKVTDMTEMFRSATRFNRDLSGWCVPLVRTAPSNFATGATAWVLPKPVWSTCPTP